MDSIFILIRTSYSQGGEEKNLTQKNYKLKKMREVFFLFQCFMMERISIYNFDISHFCPLWLKKKSKKLQD